MPRSTSRRPKPLSATAALLFTALVSAAPVDAAEPTGEALYQRHCAACHGADGRGGVGVPLALPAFLRSVDDPYLRKTIRLGRPGRVMPAFSQLTDSEIGGIVAYVRHWGQYTPPKTPPPPPGDARRGASLFAARCSACHGAEGQGGHGTGVTFSRPRALAILPPALNNPGFLAAASDAQIYRTLAEGRSGTPMQSFLNQGLTPRDLADITAHVRGFGAATKPATAVAADEGPAILRESPYDRATTIDRLRSAIGAANLRLVRIQTLDQGLVPDGQEDQSQTIVYSCDFPFLNEALKIDPRVGLFLPCRITVLEHQGKVLVLAVNPKRLSPLFNNRELDQLCDRMYDTYLQIVEETVL